MSKQKTTRCEGGCDWEISTWSDAFEDEKGEYIVVERWCEQCGAKQRLLVHDHDDSLPWQDPKDTNPSQIVPVEVPE